MSALNGQSPAAQEHPASAGGFTVLDQTDYSSYSSSDLEGGEPTDELVEKPKERHWYSRHHQVYYGICGHYEVVPSQYVDLLLDLPNLIPIIFGIVWRHDCPGIPTLVAMEITFGAVFLSLGVINFFFRVPKLGTWSGKRDDTYVCAKVLGLLGLAATIAAAVWGSIIVFPNLGKQYGHHPTSSSTSSTTGTGTFLHKDDHHYYCKTALFTSAMVMTIIMIVILVLIAVCIVVGVVVHVRNAKKKAQEKAESEAADKKKVADSVAVVGTATAVPSPQHRYLLVNAENMQPCYEAAQSDLPKTNGSTSTVAPSEVFHNGTAGNAALDRSYEQSQQRHC